jgi:hypothetical protein
MINAKKLTLVSKKYTNLMINAKKLTLVSKKSLPPIPLVGHFGLSAKVKNIYPKY